MTFFHNLNKRLADLASKQDLNESKVAESEKWIQKAVNPKTKGNLHKALHVAQDETIPKAKIEKATHSKNPKLRHMAQFAKNVAHEDIEQEGNAFTGALKATPKGGKFKVGGKEFKDTSSIEEGQCPKCAPSPCSCNEGNAFTGKLASTPKGEKFKLGNKEFKDTSSIEENYNPVKAVKQCAKDYMKMNGIRSVHDLEAEDIESIGGDCHINYQDVCEILGCNLPDSLGPVKSWDTDEHGNKFDLEEGFKEMDRWLAKREKEKGTGKFDVKDTGYSKRYTRKHEDDIESDDEDEVKSDEPKKKGRPKSAKSKDSERVTKGSHKYKTVNGKRVKKEKADEALDTDGVMMTRPSNMSSESMDRNEYDAEGDMAKGDMHTIMRHAQELETHLRDNDNLPTWVIEKLGQIKGMMTSVSDYILSQHERGVEHATGEEGVRIAERSKSQAQARMMAGAAHDPKFAKKVGVKQSVAKEFNKADTGKKMSSLPKKVKAKEEVDETTTSGSVATATTSGKSSKGGMSFGKGVYESLDKQFKQALTESIQVKSSMEECGDGEMAPALTIQADGEEAAKLMMLLKLAGLENQIPQACPTCGDSPCGCAEVVDENSPDWPTNTEKLDAEPNLRTYSGGLNGPKSSGQTTTPILNRDPRRQASMEESVELERSLFKTWKNYKG